jgi:hypothetical protein
MNESLIRAMVAVSDKAPSDSPEFAQMAAGSMNARAAEFGRAVRETPRLVEQRKAGSGHVELVFEAETVPL